MNSGKKLISRHNAKWLLKMAALRRRCFAPLLPRSSVLWPGEWPNRAEKGQVGHKYKQQPNTDRPELRSFMLQEFRKT